MARALDLDVHNTDSHYPAWVGVTEATACWTCGDPSADLVPTWRVSALIKTRHPHVTGLSPYPSGTAAAGLDEEAQDMSLNSNSIIANAGAGGDATVHSTGAFSSLGYTHVLEGAGMHPVRHLMTLCTVGALLLHPVHVR